MSNICFARRNHFEDYEGFAGEIDKRRASPALGGESNFYILGCLAASSD